MIVVMVPTLLVVTVDSAPSTTALMVAASTDKPKSSILASNPSNPSPIIEESFGGLVSPAAAL